MKECRQETPQNLITHKIMVDYDRSDIILIPDDPFDNFGILQSWSE